MTWQEWERDLLTRERNWEKPAEWRLHLVEPQTPQPPIDKPGMFRGWRPIFNALGWIVGIAVLWFVRSRL